MSIDIAVAGSLNRDLVIHVPRFPLPGETVSGARLQTFCGGKGANQSFAAARLGVRVAMAGCIGNDDAGTAQLENLHSLGVDTKCVIKDSGLPTGTALIAIEPGGQNRIIAVPGANEAFTPRMLEPAADILRSVPMLLLQLEIPLPTVLRAVEVARNGKAIIILDPAPARAVPDRLLAQVDYLTPNISELAALTGSALDGDASHEAIFSSAQTLLHRGARKVIVKMGARGALFVSSNETLHSPGFRVTAVDTTAAGDCFNAAFAVALLDGKSEPSALKIANAAAALSVTRHGAQPSMPLRAEVEAFLRSQC